jgi:NADH:ubiquinone oxidoreductase subunit H
MKLSDLRYSGIASLAVLLLFLGYWADSSEFSLLGKVAFVVAFPVLLLSLALHFGMMKHNFQDKQENDNKG